MLSKKIPDWMTGTDRLERKRVGDSAINSFADAVLNSANAMKKAGKSDDEIALAFNTDKDKLKSALRESERQKPIKCACEDDNYTDTMKQAEDAYNALHSRHPVKESDAPVRRGKSIMSAKGQPTDISNDIGSHKYIGADTNNSIWDADKLAKASKVMDNGEKITKEKEAIAKKQAENKNLSRNCTIDGSSLKDILAGTDQRSGSSIQSMAVDSVSHYSKNVPQKGMSIFDDGFSKISEQTPGEKMASEVQKEKAKDRTWVEDGAKAVTSKSILNKMINSMLGENK